MLLTSSLNQLFEKIGHKLYSIRRARNEKITVVAHHVGVSHAVISQVENGRYKSLSVKMLFLIAEYYKVSIEELLS